VIHESSACRRHPIRPGRLRQHHRTCRRGHARLGAASTATTDAAVPITGSRIPAKRTEKMVSQIGGKDYKDNKSLMAPLQSN
jgi:hypothetical protein